MYIEVCERDFDLGREYQALTEASQNAGGQVLFVGRVRDFSGDKSIRALQLSHYPGMTETIIRAICTEASQRWQIQALRVIHRVGELRAGEQIVLVAVASEHRADAFAGAEFIMDALKTRATFWKKECLANGAERWLDMKADDRERARRWNPEENQ